ncbi:MAG: sulfotransferase [Pseudomonadota bacterium]
MTSQPLVLQAIEALKRGDRRGGAALLQRDLDSGAPSPDRCRTISRLAAEIGEIDMAIEASRRSIAPATLDKLLGHWALLATYGRADEAMTEVGRVEKAVQEHPAVLHFRGTIASEQGRFDEAEDLFRRALSRDPNAFSTWFALAMNKRFAPNDPDLGTMEALVPKAERADPPVFARFLYAVGKAWDDLGDVDRAFGYIERGAEIRRRQRPYDRDLARTMTDRVIQDFTPGSMAKLVPSRAQTDRPMFVTGIPRSGTTLVEQILAAHSQVGDGAEVNLFKPALIPTLNEGMSGALAYQERAGKEDPWGEIAADYSHFLDMRFRAPGRVVDKSLGQTQLIGLLLHALPNARLVWLRRSAEDTALSCFQTYFTSLLQWSWSWADIASHLRDEERLIEHWRALFPDRILVVQYEALVNSPDDAIASILGHFGLSEEAGVRQFHASPRNIRTASVQQVRAPLSASRVGRSEAYGKYLDDFRRAYAG